MIDWVEEDAQQALVLREARRSLGKEIARLQHAQQVQIFHAEAWRATERAFGGTGGQELVCWAAYKHLRHEFCAFITEELAKVVTAEEETEAQFNLPAFTCF